MAEKTGLEEIAKRVVRQGRALPLASLENMILQELLFERRTQEAITRQQLGQAAPDLAGLRQHVGELMSKVKRMAGDATKLQGLVVRQRAANTEDRADLYRLIKALKNIGGPDAEAALAKIRPSVIKQMKTFKE